MSKTGTRRKYSEIAAELRDDIRGGRYPVGSKLPTEDELSELFGASRQTLREALRRLTEEGLIVRRPRTGSTVIARQSPTVLAQNVTSIAQLLNYPTETYRQPVETRYIEADAELASLLSCAPGTSWFHISALRLPRGSETPLCWTDIYILPEYAGVLRHPQHNRIFVADQIAEMYRVATVRTEIEISAGIVPERVADRLFAPAGSPALNILRRYTGSGGRIFEVTFGIHPADRYSYRLELHRERLAGPKQRAVSDEANASADMRGV